MLHCASGQGYANAEPFGYNQCQHTHRLRCASRQRYASLRIGARICQCRTLWL